jgi:hypothetical protein
LYRSIDFPGVDRINRRKQHSSLFQAIGPFPVNAYHNGRTATVPVGYYLADHHLSAAQMAYQDSLYAVFERAQPNIGRS